MPLKLFSTRRFPSPADSKLRSHFEITLLERGRPATTEELVRGVGDADVLYCTLTDRVDEALLEKAPKLRYIVTFSAGLDHLDLPALAKRGIKVSHTPNVLTDAV